MERRADRQHHRALGAPGFGCLGAARDSRFVAGDHDLARRIEIDRLDHFALRRFETRRAHSVVIEPEYRRHRAGAERHRVLHRLGAEAHQRQRVAKADDAGNHQRRVFAKAVTGDDRRLRTARLAPRAVHRIAGSQHQRLGIERRNHGVGRPFARELPHILFKYVRCLRKSVAHRL